MYKQTYRAYGLIFTSNPRRWHKEIHAFCITINVFSDWTHWRHFDTDRHFALALEHVYTNRSIHFKHAALPFLYDADVGGLTSARPV